MADDVDNLTLRLLQEIRSEIGSINERFDAMNGQIADLVQRVDGNTLVFNLVAGVAYNHEERITALEQPGE